jgi:ion channel
VAQPSRSTFLERAREGETFMLLFVVLLAALGWLIAAPTERWARAVTLVLFVGLTTLALRTSRVRGVAARVLGGVTLVAAVAGIGGAAGDSDAARGLTHVAFAVILVLGIVSILGRIARHDAITVETVAGALCVYVLIGMVFACVYLAIDGFGSRDALVAGTQGGLESGDYWYFSFVTLTTTGFGDVVPGVRSVQSLSMIEALLSQVLLATLVGVVVTRVGTSRRRPE